MDEESIRDVSGAHQRKTCAHYSKIKLPVLKFPPLDLNNMDPALAAAPGKLFAPTPTGKPAQRACELCSKPFLIIAQEQDFYLKKDLPWPAHCPECRQKRRLSLRNERKLYRRKCNKCQKRLFPPTRPNLNIRFTVRSVFGSI